LDLMRRLPPQQIEKNLSDLIDLVRAVLFRPFPIRYHGTWGSYVLPLPAPFYWYLIKSIIISTYNIKIVKEIFFLFENILHKKYLH